MPGCIFVSYRREDTGDAAQALYSRLMEACGASQVFMDVSTIELGQQWPDRIRNALKDASAVVVLIGENWLTSHDLYGRRRLDFEKDWVRLEISYAIAERKKIYPILIGNKTSMPPTEA